MVTDFLIDRPDMHLFWSAYDPLDLASDSIDPLGFMAGYIALADRILPGFTTITTVPRYAGMLCHALQLARQEVGDEILATSRRRKIIERLKLFERAWALSCGLAEQYPDIGGKATDGLRGVRSVHRWLSLHGQRDKLPISYALLSNQVRYGGIGAYSTFLESLHLADMNTLTLRPLGEELANAFPAPSIHGLPALVDDVRLPVDGLGGWGREAHAGTLSAEEARCLREALRGSEEAESDDRTRWVMLRLLRSCLDGDMEEPALLATCLGRITREDTSWADPDGEATKRIRISLQAIEPYERMYQCAAFIFDQLRAAATDRGQAEIEAAADASAVVHATQDISLAARRFLTELDSAPEQDGLGQARQALTKTGLVSLAQVLAGIREPVAVCQEILRRHARVQEGKFDGGLPKGPWIKLEGGEGVVVRLTAQRFGLEPSQAAQSWTDMARHPYRTHGARQFIRLCRIS